MSVSYQSIQLLPLLLSPGKSQEVSISIPGCNKLILKELIYRNSAEADLIEECYVIVNGNSFRFQKSEHNDKIYLVKGEKDMQVELEIDPAVDVDFKLEVVCQDFNVCHCKQHRFQLNISALYN